MGLWNGGCLLAAVGSCDGGTVLELPLNDCGGVVVTGPLGGGGGGGGHTADPTSRESELASLAPPLVLGFRWVDPVGRSGSVPSACAMTLVAWTQVPG
jgi:hypothetical protein